MFQVNNLSYCTDNRTILEIPDLTIDHAGTYGLIGHNGSGKSTLLKIMAGQLLPSQGQALFKGKAIHKWKTTDFAREVAYLPQQLPLSEHLTVKELIKFGRYPWLGLLGKPGEKDKAAIERAMSLTKVTQYSEQQVDSLSGGERQRVWLAMLLAQNCQFLLLDEPLAALDISHQKEILNLIQELSLELNIGVVIVLHDINLAARYCHQLIALQNGKIIDSGTAKDLMTATRLQNIYGIDMSLIKHPVLGIPVALVN